VKLARPLLFLALIALAAPRAEASISRVAAPGLAPEKSSSSIERALTLEEASPPEPRFNLFTGDELAHAAAASEAAPSFYPLAAVSLLSEDLRLDLAPEPDASYPKTRVWAIDVLGSTLVSRSSELTLETQWACVDFSCGLASGGRKDPLGLANDIDIRSNPDVRTEYCKRVPKDCSIWEREPVPVVEVTTSTATGDPRKDLGRLYAHGLSDVGAMATLGRRYPGNARQNAVVTSIGKTIEPAAPYIEAMFYFSTFFAVPIPEAGLITSIGSGTEMAEAANSVWRLGPGPRGLEIEKAFEKAGVLGERLPPNFRTIDFFDRGLATSMKSIDTTTPGYVKNPEAIFRELRDYVDSLAEFKGAVSKKYNVAITQADVTQKQLIIVIPEADISAAQRLALERGAAYARGRGIDASIITVK